MDRLWVLFLVFIIALLVFFIPLGVYQSKSSYRSIDRTDRGGFLSFLWASLPARFRTPTLDSFGRSYLQTMAGSGPAMSEQIELENMLAESDHEE